MAPFATMNHHEAPSTTVRVSESLSDCSQPWQPQCSAGKLVRMETWRFENIQMIYGDIIYINIYIYICYEYKTYINLDVQLYMRVFELLTIGNPDGSVRSEWKLWQNIVSDYQYLVCCQMWFRIPNGGLLCFLLSVQCSFQTSGKMTNSIPSIPEYTQISDIARMFTM